jgi:hypothetical protein
MVIVSICFLLSCNTFAKNNFSENDLPNNDSIVISIEKDSLEALIFEYIYGGNNEIEHLNSLLSNISKKNKIETTHWKTRYYESGRLNEHSYFCYRLLVLYNIGFRDIIADEESRLDFFIASVINNDFEVLELLDFQDTALERNSCYGETVLTAAVRRNNIEMVKYLLNRGINKNKREFAACFDDAQEELNALEIAADLGYKDIEDLLKEI